jgi:dihydropteroate synthase
MAARLWPDSLFGRLAMILFAGLVVAHVLAFVLIVLDRIAIEDELGLNLLLWTSRKRSLSSTTSSLKKDLPGSTASLDAIGDTFSEMGER